ncbi:ABC transporter permease [Bordetella genomosp. 11]|uniref:Nitrate ABC transporter permease n=1 Tax=Bordetella genomosp. 11 TaxID=1416808 RepID=A0A261UC83_9BORD|nr:ABC transporter permease subunit [Bordetella genomosp. 11]OZI59544.1 nitrate ABC transporter permease [Bordetella genomosp. 11]
MNRRPSILRNTFTLLVVVVVAWQILYWLVGDVALRSPAQTLEFALRFVTTAQFGAHLAETARAFGMALALAVIIGLAVGFVLGGHRFLGEVFEPMLIALYSIPKITLYPILLLAFGLGISSKVAFGTIHGVIPIALFTVNAVRNVRAVHLKTGRVMGLAPWDMVTRIIFPSALPEIFAGLRIGFSLTLIGTLLGEMFASQRGLGFLLMSAIGLHNVDLIMTLTVLLSLFAGTASVILLAINQRLRARMSA